MKLNDSRALLAEYAQTGSEPAFRELVSRYMSLVRSTALRLVGSDTHPAEDVTQTVFIDLARKAGQIPGAVKLGGWLHQRTFNVAAPMLRSQRRRRSREKEFAINQDERPAASNWDSTLDEAITKLGAKDRLAIALRFFERNDFRSIGEALGSNEDAARMRVNRALEKIQVFLRRRGSSVSAGSLGAALTAEHLQALTPAMESALAGTAIANSATGQAFSTMPTFIKWFPMTKVQISILGATLVTGLMLLLVTVNQTPTRLRAENEALRRQIAQLKSDNEALSANADRLAESSSRNSEELRELLRLRGEVALLRRQQRESEQLALAQRTSPAPKTSLQTFKSSPFELKMVLDEPNAESDPMTNTLNGVLNETVYVGKMPLLDYTLVTSAVVNTNLQTGAPQVEVEFSDTGKKMFADITRTNINRRIAIVADGRLYSAPVIRSEISGGKAQLTGSFSYEEAEGIATRINDALAGK